VSKLGFFGTSLVAAVPAAFMVYLVVMAFMSDSSPSGLLMIMVGGAGLMGLIVALVIPGYILMFVSKSGVIAPPKPKEKKAKKSKKKGQEDDAEEEADEFESEESDFDEFGETNFDDEFDETAVSDGGDDWDDFEEEKK
jgi:hypothetical protein